MNHEQIKVPAIRIVPVRAEDDPLPVGVPKWREASAGQASDLPKVATISVHDEKLKLSRPP